ncbi:MAG: DUF5946 family protein [Thermoanaerobaculia bacterium]
MSAPDRCGGCGLAVSGGTAGCQSIRDELLSRHLGEAEYLGVRRLFVDVYCVQHPEQYCPSFKALAAHLGHLCWSLEFGGSRSSSNEAIRQWVERNPQLVRPPLPAERGARTVGDVAAASSPAEYQAAVEAWGRSAWDAYAELQPVVRQWVASALE